MKAVPWQPGELRHVGGHPAPLLAGPDGHRSRRRVRLSIQRMLSFVQVVLLLALGSQAAVKVSNVRVRQVEGRPEIEVLCDFEGTTETPLWVAVESTDGTNGAWQSLRGEGTVFLPAGVVTPGKDRKLRVKFRPEWVGHRVKALRIRVALSRSPAGMVWIEAGTFVMGSPEQERNRSSDEGPQTEVRLNQGLYLAKYEVTQGEWEAVMGSNPSYFKSDPTLPVEGVSWEEAMEYCRWLTERERKAGRLPELGWEYRLPTEAQWEYACRAGTTTATAFRYGLSSSQGNFNGNYPQGGLAAKGPYLGKSVRVGSYAPNAWGLYDMHGNVSEWCLDWYNESLPGGSVVDPFGPNSGSDRVNRGGSWVSDGQYCRSASRSRSLPGFRSSTLGFRPALVRVP